MYGNSNFSLVLKGSCLKQKKPCNLCSSNRIISFDVYELNTWTRDRDSDFTLKHCLFGGVKLAKNSDPNKYLYSGYGIGFDTRIEF